MRLVGLTSGLNSDIRTTARSAGSADDGSQVSPVPQPSGRSSYVYVSPKPVQQSASGVPERQSSTEMPVRTMKNDVADAHRTALSALKNERFRLALEQISDVRSSEAIMMMRGAPEGASVDFRSARSLYEENNE